MCMHSMYIHTTFSQRIRGREIGLLNNINGFGTVLRGGMDVDGNKYNGKKQYVHSLCNTFINLIRLFLQIYLLVLLNPSRLPS